MISNWMCWIFCVIDPCATTGNFEHVPNEHAIGAEPRPNIGTLAECKAACQKNDSCTAVDWKWVWLFYISFNKLRPRQNGRHFPDDIFKYILLNENVWILLKISLKFVPKGPIDNISSLIQIMAWRRWGDKPLSEAMVFSLLTHICVTRPQWVNWKWGLPIQTNVTYIQALNL